MNSKNSLSTIMRGYCKYYLSAMELMNRTKRIPGSIRTRESEIERMYCMYRIEYANKVIEEVEELFEQIERKCGPEIRSILYSYYIEGCSYEDLIEDYQKITGTNNKAERSFRDFLRECLEEVRNELESKSSEAPVQAGKTGTDSTDNNT